MTCKECKAICAQKFKDNHIKIVLRVLGIALSLVGFLYQTSELLSVYLSGKTSVDNRVERLKHSELPAITVCLPTFVSMDKFAEHLLKNSTNQTLRQTYDDYQNFIKTTNKQSNEQANSSQNKFWKLFVKDTFLDLNVTMAEVFDKISVDSLNLSHFQTIALDQENQIINLTKPKYMQSLVPFSDPRKCFTLFSGFDSSYNGKKFNLIKLKMQFFHNKDNFPTSLYDSGDFHISLHSANTLPLYKRGESFLSLMIGKYYTISYSEKHVYLLQAPYETDCQTYPLDDLGQNQMRSDCIQKCVDGRLLDEFPEVKCLFTYNNYKLIRRENLFNFSSTPYCHHMKFNHGHLMSMTNAMYKFEIRCNSLCKENCHDIFYDFDLDKVNRLSSDLKNGPDQFIINIQHNRFPDQIITHRPIMSWIGLVSNFGGLLGMWLGLSIAFVFDHIFRLI